MGAQHMLPQLNCGLSMKSLWISGLRPSADCRSKRCNESGRPLARLNQDERQEEDGGGLLAMAV